MHIQTEYELSKESYINLLNDTISIVESKKLINNDEYLYEIILAQLIDIKELIVEKNELIDEDDINERYSLGSIAIKNFEEDDELRERLCDIFSGAFDFAFLP